MTRLVVFKSVTLSFFLTVWCSKTGKVSFPCEKDVTAIVKSGSSASYRAEIEISTDSAGGISASRNVLVVWDQRFGELRQRGELVEVEVEIKDVAFEYKRNPFPTERLTTIINRKLSGSRWKFVVSTKSGKVVDMVKAPELFWQEVVSKYMEGISNGRSVEPVFGYMKNFLVEMLNANFSHRPIVSIIELSLPAVPSYDEYRMGRWERLGHVSIGGIMAEVDRKFKLEGWGRYGERRCVLVSKSVGSIEGREIIRVPSDNAPLMMEMEIVGGSMKGQLCYGPPDGTVIKSWESYDVTVRSSIGLPSLKKGEKLKPLKGSVLRKIHQEIIVEKIM